MERVKYDPRVFELDIHASVFSPKSFRLVMEELYRKGLIHMPLVYVDEDTEYGEFFAVFKKGASQEERESYWEEAEKAGRSVNRKCAIERIDIQGGFLIIRGFSSVRGKQPVETEVRTGRTAIRTVREMRPDLSDNINAINLAFSE